MATNLKSKPEWWPENPYPVEIFTRTIDQYPEIIPDPDLRTAVSGMLGREFWEIASNEIWRRMQEAEEEKNNPEVDTPEWDLQECMRQYDHQQDRACQAEAALARLQAENEKLKNVLWGIQQMADSDIRLDRVSKATCTWQIEADARDALQPPAPPDEGSK